MANANLHAARAAKKDEFYTSFTDVNEELQHYREHFRDKVVFLNCDDSTSEFWKFFSLTFEMFGLKKLIATHYEADQPSYKLELNEYGGEVIQTPLEQNGDFRSPESLAILEEADIVVTNPPFSLFKPFISILEKLGKKYLIMGNNNAITYKEVIPLIMSNKMWLGVNSNKTMEFRLPDHYEKWNRIDENGNKYGNVSAISWFTNLEHSTRNEWLCLSRDYDPEIHPAYDNYDAIEVSYVVDIPIGYKGVMGVPISFLTKYNPDQFEILGTSDRGGDNVPAINEIRLTEKKMDSCYVRGQKVYKRLFIRAK